MRLLALLAALLAIPAASAQDEPKAKKKPVAKKTAPAAKQVAHKKPTPEQIRRFKELEKKKKQ